MVIQGAQIIVATLVVSHRVVKAKGALLANCKSIRKHTQVGFQKL